MTPLIATPLIACMQQATGGSCTAATSPLRQPCCAEFLRRLAEKEHEHGIAYDKDVDAFLQACTVEGKASHPLTNFFLRILGLEVSQSCIVHSGGYHDVW